MPRAQSPRPFNQNKSMKILIIGGTKFVGRYIAQFALEQGHELTLFNRGKTNADLFPEAEHVHGDRLDENGFGALKGRRFDAVVDTCGYFPRATRLSCQAFSDSGRYVFISTISVFKDTSVIGLREEDELGTIDDETTEEVTGETYGPLKVLCEKVVQESFGERALIIRPGLIVGPHDPTDRFTYWPVRFAMASGPVLAPDCKNQPVQQIDVRDLCSWTGSMIEQGASGVYTATGPDSPVPLSLVLEEVRQAVNPGAKIVWANTAWLTEKEVQPWSDLPMVLPYDGSNDGMRSVDISKALAAGLKFRPTAETSIDILKWWKAEGSSALKTGLSDEREAELLGELSVER